MTITYELNGGNGTDSDCTPSLGNNEQALATRTDTFAIARSIPQATTDEESVSWTTLADNPNSADWPSGDYVGSMDINAMEAGASIKIQLLRINSACTIQQTLGTSTSLSGTGVKSYTWNGDPGAGNASDRYQMRVLGSNSEGHKAQQFSIVIADPDTFISGAWVVVGVSIPIVMHHYKQMAGD